LLHANNWGSAQINVLKSKKTRLSANSNFRAANKLAGFANKTSRFANNTLKFANKSPEIANKRHRTRHNDKKVPLFSKGHLLFNKTYREEEFIANHSA
jgi:hypothetical protein